MRFQQLLEGLECTFPCRYWMAFVSMERRLWCACLNLHRVNFNISYYYLNLDKVSVVISKACKFRPPPPPPPRPITRLAVSGCMHGGQNLAHCYFFQIPVSIVSISAHICEYPPAAQIGTHFPFFPPWFLYVGVVSISAHISEHPLAGKLFFLSSSCQHHPYQPTAKTSIGAFTVDTRVFCLFAC